MRVMSAVRPRLVIGVIGIVMALVITWFAATSVATRTEAADSPPPPTFVTVTEGTLGHTIPAAVTVTRANALTVRAPRDGTLTRPVADEMIDVGDPLLWINEEPVIAAEGKVPAFRELKRDMSGSDVEQLQTFLRATGHLPREVPIDGEFGPATETAVIRWHAEHDITGPAAAIITPAELIFVPELPASVLATDGVHVGSVLSSGQEVAQVLEAAPSFAIHSEGDIAAEFREGLPVTVPLEDETLHAITGAPTTLEDGRIQIPVTLPEPCGSDCAPLRNGQRLSATVTLAEKATGPLVPVAALRQKPDGSTYVTTREGADLPVTVQIADRGAAIVSGIDPGSEVLIVTPEDRSG